MSQFDSKITLVTGGVRSGKSSYALKQAESYPNRRLFIATAPSTDGSMSQRIQKHQHERNHKFWTTLEEEHELPERISELEEPYSVLVIDCLTLWLSNLLLRDNTLDEDSVSDYASELLTSICKINANAYLVTNELGMSVHPPTELGRRFQDLQGRLNQEIAKASDNVVLLVSGMVLPLQKIP